MSDGLLTPREAAAYLRVSLRTLYNLNIRRIKIGRSTRFDPSDLRLFVALNADRKPLMDRAS